MSMARVTTVKSARKDQGKCEKDGTLLPKGSTYRWFTVGFRSRYIHKRCMNPSCTPTRAELESSMLADIYSAQDDATAELEGMRDSLTDTSDVESVVDTFRDAVEDVASRYREADDALGGTGATPSGETADALEQVDLDWSAPGDSEPPACAEHEDGDRDPDCADCEDAAQTWRDEVIDSAIELIDNVELGV